MCFSPQRRTIFRRVKSKKCFGPDVFCTFSLENVLFATAAYNFSTSERTKVVQTRHVLYIFTSECYLSPQGRAFFQHQNLQKWSEHVMFCAFSLPNVLFATAAGNFSSVCWAPTSAPAVLTGLLFDWRDTRIIEKTQHFATSLTFRADVSSFF